MPRTKPRGYARLSLERLEARDVMAANFLVGVNSGCLCIIDNDPNQDDAITVRKSNGQITIDGVAGSFNAAQIGAMYIDSGTTGNTVRLDSQSFAGGQALQFAITVHAGGGSTQVTATNGTTYYLSGAQDLVLFQGGSAALGGAAPTWFDSNIRDAAIRALAKSSFADNVLDRADTIGILRQAQQGGTVTADELADLKKIVNNTTLFGSFGYVQVLASDVVNGNAANAKYQGQALGNLVAGSTSTHLEKLVQKWFYGADRPLGQSDWGPTYAYRQASGTLFGAGIGYTDVRQGGLGDCYFLAALAEVSVKNSSKIYSMFIVNGDGTYTVRFYNNGKADYVTVDSYLPTDSSGRFVFANMGEYASNPYNKLWVALAEKAYVQMNECGWVRPSYNGGGQNTYIAISGGWIADALRQVEGTTAYAFASTSTSTSFNSFMSAYNSGQLIGFASKTNPTMANVVGNHAYAVVGYDPVYRTVILYNPWGINNGSTKPGLIALTWSQIQSNFSYYDRALV